MKKLVLFLLFIVLSSLSLVAQEESPAYLNPDLDVEARVADLLGRMSLEEKIGQMTLVEVGSIDPFSTGAHYIGGILSGGGGSPRVNTAENWALRTDEYQEFALATELGIPMIYGVDAIHGHNNIYGAVIYPHNIGLGATHNPELVRRIGQATACDMMGTGIYWNYAPVLAVPQDIRWGRTYEGYAQDTTLVTELSSAFISGLQGDNFQVAATPKHFIGDGATIWGTSLTGDYSIDQGDAIMDEETLRETFLSPYAAAVDNGAMVIMTSFSSWNGVKMHAQAYLVNDVLKGELGFNGFVVSDWQAIDQISSDYYTATVTAVNAGIDMNMVPYAWQQWITTLTEAVNNGDVSMERIDDAVSRILRVKFMLGLFEHPYHNEQALAAFSNDSHRALARQAVSQSMVLLQNNNNVLPLSPNIETLFLAGSGMNDIGMQSGGWTLTWQGSTGNITVGTSIRSAIEAAVSPETTVYYNSNGRYRGAEDAAGNPIRGEVGIVVVGEAPYSEGVGDSDILTLKPADVNAIAAVRERVDKLIVIVISGRPLIITEQLEMADAWISASLPGSEGSGVADVLFGTAPFTGTLSFAWPRDTDQVPYSALLADDEAPLFPIGYGITTGSIDDYELVQPTCGE
jgi:beta-glucosidase